MTDRRRPFRIGEQVLVAVGIHSTYGVPYVREMFEAMVLSVPDPPGHGHRQVSYVVARDLPSGESAAFSVDKSSLFYPRDRPHIDAILAVADEIKAIDQRKMAAYTRYITPIEHERSLAMGRLSIVRKELEAATQPPEPKHRPVKGATQP